MTTRVVGFYINRDSGLFCSNGNTERPTGTIGALEFLLKNGGEPSDGLNVLSDLDSDVAALLGMIGATKETLKTLYEEETARIGHYTLKYFPDKFFAVEKDGDGRGSKRKWANFADASQYAYGLREVRNDKSQGYGEMRAQVAAGIGQEVESALVKLGLYPTSLVSPSSVWVKHYYDTGIIELPSIDKIPEEASVMAYECCDRNWVQTWKRGHWDKAYDYDLNSAYPAEAAKLMDLDDGEWEQSSKYQEKAGYGYCRCIVKANDVPFSPLIMRLGTELFTPRGEWIRSFNKRHIDFIRHNKELGKIEILDGWWWFPNSKVVKKPLADAIDLMYQRKEKAEGTDKEVIKRLMSGAFYGVFTEERKGEIGEYACFPWAAEIEMNTKLNVAMCCIAQGIVPISVAVDGIITEEQLTKTPFLHDGLGGWRLSHVGKCLSIGTGLVAMEHKDGEGDFALTYDRAMQIMKEASGKDEWKMDKMGVVKLARAVVEKRWGDIGKVEPLERWVDLSENKMDYDKHPKKFGDLMKNKYQGKPWGVEMLKMLGGDE